MTRILVIDDHPIFRQGLCTLLEVIPDIDCVMEASSPQEALLVAQRGQPDVVLLDIRFPGESGLSAVSKLREILPDGKVLLLTAHDDPEYLRMGLQVGADGFLSKGIGQRGLTEAISQVLEGRRYVDPHFGPDALNYLRRQPATLTPREAAVLNLVANGLSNKQIARRLRLSVDTVKFHLKHLFKKLDVSNRAQAVTAAIKAGLLVGNADEWEAVGEAKTRGAGARTAPS